MEIQENIKLGDLTTFGTGGLARYFVTVGSEDELKQALEFAEEKKIDSFILAGGSNTIFSDNDYDGIVIKINFKGIQLDGEILTAASGESWDQVVQFAVDHNLWGIENLSAIPGLTGAAAVQNIGAYGQEVSDVIDTVEVYDKKTHEIKMLSNQDCNFGYRSSIFNTTAKGAYIILKISFKLSADGQARADYPDVVKYFSEHTITGPTMKQMREAITEIRASKFTKDPNGKAGSFFKNLYLTSAEYEKMHAIMAEKKPEKLSELEAIKDKFPTGDSKIKIPAAWIIDKVLNLKGKRIGTAMISETQALAILNPDRQAKSEDVKKLIDFVIDSVYEVSGQRLDLEPELVGF